jgi:uncharacterized RDD family membrane protein YckC
MEPKIHVCRNKDTLGVFTEAQLKMALGRGSITENDYCWTDGMKDWKPIGQTYAHLVPARPASQQTTPPYPAAPYQPPGPSQNYVPQAPTNRTGYGQPSFVYPSGGERFGAYLLDGLFMSLLFCCVLIPAYGMLAVIFEETRGTSSEMQVFTQLITFFLGLFGSLLYHGLQGTTAHNATWGQRIMGFKMVDARTGAPPQSGQIWQWAFFRSIIMSCCSCIGLLFFIPILNDFRKQSAFDSWADILMVKK